MHPLKLKSELMAQLEGAIKNKDHKKSAEISLKLFELTMKQLGYSDEVIQKHKNNILNKRTGRIAV